MPDIPSIESVIEWIESHEKTVDLLKWIALLLVAWVAGAFRFLRNNLRRPSATIEEVTSRCLIEKFSEFQGHKDAIRATFLVEVGVLNPTSESAVVRYFSLGVPRRRLWRRWKPELVALSLPNRPRHQMGSGVKFLKNWFSNFADEFHDLTLSGTVEPKAHRSGYLLFVCFASGSWAPRIEGDFVTVKARVHLTTGETYSASGKVRVTSDKEKFEEWVPGIIEHVSHESAWGGFR